MTFEITFFDGVTAHPRQALLTIINRVWTLIPKQPEEPHHTWSDERIKLEHYRPGASLVLRVEGELVRIQASAEVADLLYQRVKHRETLFQKCYSWMNNVGSVRLVAIGLVVMVGLILSYALWVSPMIGRLAANLMTIEQEASIGHKMADRALEEWEIDHDKSAILQAFFDNLGFDTDYPVRCFVVDETAANALAFPGGTIVVFDSILSVTEDWQQLAALLAHELAHINERHSLETVCRNLSTYLLISVLSGDVGGVSGILIENATKLERLAYSRSLESEADQFGARYLKAQGIDPGNMRLLFDNLERHSIASSRLLQYLSTHPLGEARSSVLPERSLSWPEPSMTSGAKALFRQLHR
ncbi:MAG: M48 family metallopeptidase [Saprospiraceae bacterium]|nr:M48 family metallopeptidase [Saprospiraceae bacterium]